MMARVEAGTSKAECTNAAAVFDNANRTCSIGGSPCTDIASQPILSVRKHENSRKRDAFILMHTIAKCQMEHEHPGGLSRRILLVICYGAEIILTFLYLAILTATESRRELPLHRDRSGDGRRRPDGPTRLCRSTVGCSVKAVRRIMAAALLAIIATQAHSGDIPPEVCSEIAGEYRATARERDAGVSEQEARRAADQHTANVRQAYQDIVTDIYRSDPYKHQSPDGIHNAYLRRCLALR